MAAFGPGSIITSAWLNDINNKVYNAPGGTVTSVGISTANGFSGSVANPGTTPVITLTTNITGLLKGSSNALVAAVAGTDFSVPTGVETLTNKTIGSLVNQTLAVGTSPFSWGGTSYAVDAQTAGIMGASDYSALTYNAYYSGQWLRKYVGFSGMVTFNAGTFAIYKGSNGSAGTASGFAAVMQIDVSNNTTFSGTLDAAGGVTSGGQPVATTNTAQTLTSKTFGGYTEVVTSANSGTAYTFNLAGSALFFITLTGNVTFTMPTAVAGKSFIVQTKQDATGSRTVAWSSVLWPGGTAPTATSTATKSDKYLFQCLDGTNWLGVDAGRNF